MCIKFLISVMPFAAIPAIIKAAPALKSLAETDAPDKDSTPSKIAVLPSGCDICSHFI